MKIVLTKKELLDLAKNCLQSTACGDCVLNGFCENYYDLDKLCEIEGAQTTDLDIDYTKLSPVLTDDQSGNETISTVSEKIGGVAKTTDELVEEIIGASEGQAKKPENGSKAAARDRNRIRKLLCEGVGEYGDEFIDHLYAAGEGVIEREELMGMVSGVKYPIGLWRIAEQVYRDAGY